MSNRERLTLILHRCKSFSCLETINSHICFIISQVVTIHNCTACSFQLSFDIALYKEFPPSPNTPQKFCINFSYISFFSIYTVELLLMTGMYKICHNMFFHKQNETLFTNFSFRNCNLYRPHIENCFY